jgi:hypothetical protein
MFSGIIAILFCVAFIATSVLPIMKLLPPIALVLAPVYLFLGLMFSTKTWETMIYVANSALAVKIIEDKATLPDE